MYDDKVIEALAYLRAYMAVDAQAGAQRAFNELDNAGVFADLDEQTDYASAEAILAESALASVPSLDRVGRRALGLD